MILLFTAMHVILYSSFFLILEWLIIFFTAVYGSSLSFLFQMLGQIQVPTLYYKLTSEKNAFVIVHNFGFI